MNREQDRHHSSLRTSVLRAGALLVLACGLLAGPAWAQHFESMEYYHYDALGSVRLVVSYPHDSMTYTISRHDYLPFGEEIQPGTFGRARNLGYGTGDTTPQRFTAKERDPESNLDYFGARYYSGAQGRFTSPDPIHLMPQKLLDPQQWDGYTYARSSPLRFIDPTGMWVCTASDKDCKRIENTRSQNLKSKDDRVVRAARAFGPLSKKAGDEGDNGISVSVYRGKAGSFGTAASRGEGLEVANGTVRQATDVTINMESNLEEAVTHEGAHCADRADYAATVDPTSMQGDLRLDITHYESEVNAFTAQNVVIAGRIDLERRKAGAQTTTTFSGTDRIVLTVIDIPKTLREPPYSNMPYLYNRIFPYNDGAR